MAKRKTKDPVPPRSPWMAAPSTLRPEATVFWAELLESIELSDADIDVCDSFLLARLANNLKALSDAEAALAKAGNPVATAQNGISFVIAEAKRVDTLAAECRQLLKMVGLAPSARKVRPIAGASGSNNDIELMNLEFPDEEFEAMCANM